MTRGVDGFDDFAAEAGERLRRALVARFGVEVGNDVTDEALVYAWEHWERLRALGNPVGYLYRVGQSAARRHARWHRAVRLPLETWSPEEPSADPGLAVALARLKPAQRTCIVLVHVYGWTYAETAAALELTVAAVRNHLHRGLGRLRLELEDE